MIDEFSSLTFCWTRHILWKKNVCSISRESKCDVLQHFWNPIFLFNNFLLSTPPRSPRDARLKINLFINASNGAFYATGISALCISLTHCGGFVKVWNAIFLIVFVLKNFRRSSKTQSKIDVQLFKPTISIFRFIDSQKSRNIRLGWGTNKFTLTYTTYF